jgi:hypothetical protein
MILQLTKKLANRFKLGKLSAPPEIHDSFYSWRATTYLDECSLDDHYLIFVNDASRFIIYINKYDTDRDLTDLLFETLRDTLLADNINPLVIDRYMAESGKSQLCANSASSRRETSWLAASASKAMFNKYQQLLEEDSTLSYITSSQSVQWYSNESKMNMTINPCEQFYSQLLRYGLPIHDGQAFDLKVSLIYAQTEVVRKLRLSANITFNQLHKIIHSAFFNLGMFNEHFYNFKLYKEQHKLKNNKKTILKSALTFDLDEIELDNDSIFGKIEPNIRLRDYLPEFTKIVYTYDYKYEIKFHISVENVIDNCTEELPILLSAYCNSQVKNGQSPVYSDELLFKLKQATNLINDPFLKMLNEWRIKGCYFDRYASQVKHSLKY